MELLLWRHAEAENGYPDSARRLTARGTEQAARMAAWLRKHAPDGLRIVVSPAQRALETIAPFSAKYEVMAGVGTDADVDTLLQAVGWPDAGGAVLVVGHQPTLGEVAARLLGGAEEVSLAVRKGAIWWFSGRVREGQGEIVLKAVIPPSLT